ncbi:Tm-1-like ATP-binding domain-containing protein [Pleomorphovibrio marinus]|uniref:Tm-1-like ATP-binding domain-containing protein n=1 Tax=Pleomorphovibrio marinus TaxID=2164132 RepID=UPI000E0AFE7B|nr:Tm-1-like ATP-binding domain-containing protein [Pleomorphovibrio marinus]
MAHKIVVVGTFDTKGEEFNYLLDLIKSKGNEVITINAGVMGTTDHFEVDISAADVAQASGNELMALRKDGDRGKAVAAMSVGVAKVIKDIYNKTGFDGIIGMGGSAGTNIVSSCMRELPYGLPKVCLSTIASGDVSPYIGISDMVLMPSITDISGINSLSKITIGNAVGALLGMLEIPKPYMDKKRAIAASMFGNTTPCIDLCRKILNQQDYEVLVFHATGNGGKTMEKLVKEGLVQGVLDITTTEWADTLCGGIFSAGKERLDGPGQRGIPHLIAPGCIDMCNFGNPSTIPSRYKDRLFYEWNPNVTLMRTNVEENRELGKIFAQKANAAKGKTAFILPMKGFSMLDALNEKNEPELFWDEAADKAFLEGLKHHLDPKIEVEELNMNINHPDFAKRAVEKLLDMM